MARPQKQGMDYFPHDTDASNDEKLEVLRALYGNDGYAFYFILLERIYRTADFELDVSDAETIQILAKKVEVTREKFSEMLQTALKRRCFCPESYAERQVLTSPGIKKRAQGVVQKRSKMASAYQQRQDKPLNSGSARVSDAETTPETGISDELPSREKESKEKESKENISSSTSSTREDEKFDALKAESEAPANEEKNSADSYFHYSIKLKAERQFVESACMSLRIPEPDLPKLIDQFTHEQRALQKHYPDYSDYKSHCFNWLRIQSTKTPATNANARPTPGLSIAHKSTGPVNVFGQGADLSGKVYRQEGFK